MSYEYLIYQTYQMAVRWQSDGIGVSHCVSWILNCKIWRTPEETSQPFNSVISMPRQIDRVLQSWKAAGHQE